MLLNSIKLLNSITLKHYNILFVLTLNCHDNYRTITVLCQLLFCLMIENFAFVLMYHVETSQLICCADHLSEFYLVHGIERNFETTCGFFIVILTGPLCLYLIGSLLSVFFFLYLTCYSISDQGCAQLLLLKDTG